jgi:hypothetical protein
MSMDTDEFYHVHELEHAKRRMLAGNRPATPPFPLHIPGDVSWAAFDVRSPPPPPYCCPYTCPYCTLTPEGLYFR